jgi:RNA polymerase sigma-70 factor (ECF subfamily)
MSSVLPAPGDAASLADRIRLGDRDAEAALASAFYDRVRLMALARTRDVELARDIAQDTIAEVLIALREGRLREQEKLAGFVCGTARNRISDHYRTRGRLPQEEPLDVEPAGDTGVDPLEQAERDAHVRGALGTLPVMDRRILLMTLVDGLKPGVIAQRLSLSDEVVRARKSRAIKKVKEYVDRASRS